MKSVLMQKMHHGEVENWIGFVLWISNLFIESDSCDLPEGGFVVLDKILHVIEYAIMGVLAL